ncbi:alkaline ceramidase ydc1 [Exophiala xenobiotica]|nr:alkaline ceramidase ydc1 [Exophiala xenobiotica]KAK5217376.1 alkaline ceramidase ydc1 [Exophiala xenobiotica]KAK5242530.1 alkaline ceramidase ydc1 [Exophiala xenobiotica]KAK5280207.1 alkaline ceramidase ydc1 [Exophiala xenobiotica]KAK5283152.1 alkaline ceramidase ydc1 [Exophiala xenobiotica]
MWHKMVPVALGLNLLGFFFFASNDGLRSITHSPQQELDLRRRPTSNSQGWWHLSIGVAQYFNITWSIWLEYCCEGKQDDIELIWPSLFLSLPSVENHAKRAALQGPSPLRG